MSIVNIVDTLGGEGAVRITELGKIKIGGLGESRKTQTGGTFRLPQKHDHFTITTMNRTPTGDLVVDQALMDQLIDDCGDEDGKLRQIPIRVLSDDIEEVLQCAYLWYGGKTVGARSDGKTVTWFCDRTNGKKLPKPFEEPWKPEFLELTNSRNQKLFKLHTVLNCIIAARVSRFGGVYKMRTTSIISFKQLYACLTTIHQTTGGVLMGMPLMLVVRPVQVAPEGQPSTVYVLHIELRGEDMMKVQSQALTQMQYRLENKQKMLQAQQQYRQLLLPPGHESEHDAADIASEFAPEMQAAEPAPEHVGILDDPIDASKVDHDGGNAAAVADREVGQPTTEAPFDNAQEDPRSPEDKAEQWVAAQSEKDLRKWVASHDIVNTGLAVKAAKVDGITAAHPFKNIQDVAYFLKLAEFELATAR